MSSEDVRSAINAAVETAASPVPVFDLSDYVSLEDCLGSYDASCVLIQYVASDDEVTTIGGYQNQGWAETGSVVLHYMVPTGFDSLPAVQKGDQMRKELRGRRLTNSVVIEACTPFSDSGGGLYGAAWHGWVANIYYEKRDCG